MRDRLTRRDTGPVYLVCPNCGQRGVNFMSIGFCCAGGCSATAREITEAGDDIEKLKKILRENRKINLAFEKKPKFKKKKKRRARN